MRKITVLVLIIRMTISLQSHVLGVDIIISNRHNLYLKLSTQIRLRSTADSHQLITTLQI
jgi:hypothetical protein